VHETSLNRTDLYTADELFFTGSATEVIPIREVDGRFFEPGPITQSLQQRYTEIVHGRDEKYIDWLDFVE
jgi:branched-chain amino acid aminotransferase